ncbi:hypothetical protein F5Y00DRAFT_265987 [Daldinia vernicosa]|uniref:uncharacterized protein n=1 Tax=Daldinia vernicosa TaxID=114800 RepID=UPI002007C7A6|nr:uncharacterized protein F5Y00DRAFT_265987 [Daldinia vernicosa]KAI0845021.1 hypothetical protein F5Y00DRAFT_265987 [Daldinia vernicosa]
MQAIDYGYSLLTAEQHLLSPNSTGHSYSGQCHPHRCHSHSCKSAPAEQRCDENNREFEDGHWLFSPEPHTFHLRPTGAPFSCQARRAPQTCKDRSLTPVSPNSVGSEDLNNQWELGADDELIANWLSGVSYSNCPNEETRLTGKSTPATSPDAPDSGGGVDVGPACPSIVLQPPRQNRSIVKSGTGLDGPLSSESDKLSKLLRDGLSDLKESSRSADLSGGSQKLKSNTSGRSNSGSEVISDEKLCFYLSQPNAQSHAVQRHAHNSCPEFCRHPDDFGMPPSRLEGQGTQARAHELRLKVDKNRHWHHLRVRDILTNQFRFLRQRFRRSNSSTLSTRSEFPAPRRSKERRLLARDPMGIWPPSGEESPLFNTPESIVTNAKRTSHDIGRHIDPLAIASVMIATAELDRLSSRRSLDLVSGRSGSSTGVSGNSPTSHTPCHSGVASPSNEISAPTSPALDMPPTIPFNTPLSSGPQSGVISPVSKSSQRRGQRRKTQRSLLSEVTTPDDVASLAESTEEFNEGLSISVTHIETLPECSCIPSEGTEESLYPQPLIISRSGQEEANSRIDDTSEFVQEYFPRFEPLEPVLLSADMGYELDTLQRLPDSLTSDAEDVIPSRISSICEMSKTGDESLLPSMPLGLGHAFLMPTTSSNLIVSRISRETLNTHSSSVVNIKRDVSAVGAVTDYTVKTGQPDKVAEPDSCHPDTWSESQGEPGNSDPFCPPDCLETRRSSQDSLSRRLTLAKQNTDETIYKLKAEEGAAFTEESSL